ncbi:transposase [Streptomyces viridosporus ATCC 14672]|uniref:Transposase n=1 Tax=Streptomyces viridosporus (strain ATCC 14672 / DSM 40746 / JCM 4963 / KCTC 9882 / NRRL B-12104 / FH 1290) TaxID=566461 RepID=D5ZQA4_STRV1|nr:transposase [Streptomyces viridosporus ATCC 14672]
MGELADGRAPDAGGQVTVDLDGVLVVAHSDKQDAAPAWKKTYKHHPLLAFVDHGPGGTGEPVAAFLRPGNSGSNTAADHISAARLALAQLPNRYRRGRRTSVGTPDADPLRFRRRHPRVRRLARSAGTVAVLLGRHGDHRGRPPARPQDPRVGLDPGRRVKW